MADQNKPFGTLLRETRVARGYSLRKFAEMVDVSPTYLSQVEQGKVERPPTAERVRVMAELLGQNPAHWITLAGREPEYLAEMIRNEPALPELLRAAQGLTAEQLKKLTEQARRQSQKGDK